MGLKVNQYWYSPPTMIRWYGPFVLTSGFLVGFLVPVLFALRTRGQGLHPVSEETQLLLLLDQVVLSVCVQKKNKTLIFQKLEKL